MIHAGFDPSFIDINIRPLTSENELLSKLPAFGEHWPNTEITFIPGGNGFNFCRTLSSLGENTTYVGPLDDFFVSLVNEQKINVDLIGIEGAKVNYTAILNTHKGEIQFNNIRGELSPSLLNEKILKLFLKSPVKPISNIAFNPKANEWVSSLLLGLREEYDQLIFSDNTKLEEKIKLLNGISFEGIIFVDPSDISHYPRIKEFFQILQALNTMEGDKYLSVNEFEMNRLLSLHNISPLELSKTLNYPIIFHTTEVVKFYYNGEELYSLDTQKLSEKKTFVGAGDVFNASFVFKVLKSSHIEDALNYAIKSASFLIEKGVYPSSENLK
ncbi:MAG: carbohydrate kinase family protein [Candidatus Heimdallarchaeum aukensis]|uniref:Carbohydrate kinase family protein n=1 Tax=Candidatus Heimdallarchaeum aukensis TaxID=2876573 RepID=A0A9Y1BND4_9ARCH|nr:MAG: carbohydrate kinase family protein [Candidatus Heimdallarchaeum aukensis]